MKTINEKTCREIFIQYNNKLKNKWYILNGTKNVGCMTYLYKKYNNPKTYQQFYEAYITDKYNKKNPETCGRNEEYLNKVARKLMNLDNNEEQFSVYYNYIIQKLIIDTYDGLQKENQIKQKLINKGYTCVEPTYYEDVKLSIDFKVYKDNNLYCLVQIKPLSFFLGNRNQSLIQDRIKAIKKEKKAEQQFKVPLVYIIYKDDKLIKNNKGNIAHRLLNLINLDGTIKFNLNF